MTFNKSDNKSDITDPKNKNSENTDSLNSKLQQIPIAVIGVASVFPDAENADMFWDNIINEVDSIVDVPPSRWNIDDYYDPDPKVPDKTYSRWGGFLPDVDFNPMDFGLPPNILEVTDVSQLLALLVARKVLEDAGYGDENAYDRSKIGVTLGVGGGQKLITPLTSRLQYPIWKRVLTKSGVSDEDADIIVEKIKKAYIPWEENSFPGMLGNVIAGRVANRLNLGGTNCVLDAACASSLTAIKLAVSDLLEYRSEIMISGGVDTDNSPFMYLCFSKTPAFSPGDKSKPFDIDSKGMLVGEGVGMVALKRLEDAERDNDRIYAVLKGIGTSSDGKFKSIYAPRPEGQAKALNQAYEIAGISPRTMGLIEAHGTGTVAGDNAEFTALKTVFGNENPKNQYIALGSVKSQIGHTKAAAGSAGFIKAALALHHKVLPATINVKTPHPKMDVENTPFYINSETRPWFPAEEGHPRRAGISSFGFGGTNFHVVLEEYTQKPEGNFRKHTLPYSIIISDSSPENLQAKCTQIQKELESEDSKKAFFNFVNQYKTAPIKTLDARLGFVCSSASDALELIALAKSSLEAKSNADTWEHPKGIYFRKQGIETSGKVAALFSGQGSQYINMGKTVSMNFPPVMDSFAQMDELFIQDNAKPLTSLVYPFPKFTEADKKADQAVLQKTENVQPSIGAFSAGLYRLLNKAGFSPDYAAGHSFGELTALWAAEVLSDEDYFFLARARGKAMAPPDDENFDAGTMSAVMGDVKNLEAALKDFQDVVIANHNSNTQVVIAGPVSDVLKANDALKNKGYTVIPLSVSAAFHTPLVGHAQKPFAQAIKTKTFNTPKCKVYSNATGTPYPEKPEAIQKILEDHILNSVLFKDEIENIYNDGARIFVEFGPKNVLTKLASNILKDKPHVAVALNASPKKCSDTQLRQAAVQLCVAGIPLEDIDIYRELKDPGAKKPGLMNISLNGSNYISEKTRNAYEEALNDGHKIKQAEVITKIVEVPVVKTVEKVVEKVIEKSAGHSRKNEKKGKVMEKPYEIENTSLDSPQVLDKIEQSIGQFFNHQGETLKVHSQQIDNAREYTKSFYDLMGQQFDLLRERPETKIPESIERSMDMFHTHQGDTLNVHAQYLENQAKNSVAALEFMKQKYGADVEIYPAYSTPEIAIKPAVARIENGRAPLRGGSLTEPVTEPVTSQAPEPKPEPPVIEKTTQEQPKHEQITQPKPLPVPAPPAPSGIDHKTLTDAMLNVVAEKTGYPTEMLELDMDMEADLGIDSIKRVEILAAVMEQFPEIPEVNPDELAPLKTLAQIVEKLTSEIPETVNEPPRREALPSPSGPNVETLTTAMLSVVAEKTGYPTEMLELDMDMEADLGIDSIKRVEILAAVMEQFPELPEVNPDDLAPLKTLGQIVDKLTSDIPAAGNEPPRREALPSPSGPNVETLTAAMLSVVAEKTGYPSEMLELDMDMEADLGIDSIKRVEILAAVMEQFPELPEVNPDELAPLKTLGQIVDKLTSDIPAAVNEPPRREALPSVSGPNLEILTDTMLNVVSEKTGYPVEMLELEMDMEAELGIDSIKRVEILAAVMDKFPGLPEFNPDELSVLKTLGEVVNKMASASGASSEPEAAEKKTPEITQEEKPGELKEETTRSIVRIQNLPKPDFLEFDIPENKICLITDDGTELTSSICKALDKKGCKIVVLSLPKDIIAGQAGLPENIDRIFLEDMKEETLKAALKVIKSDFGQVGGFIHLNPVLSSDSDNLFPEKEKDILLHVFLMAKHLKDSLVSDNSNRRFFITTARIDGSFGLSGKASSLIPGGLFGLTKTLNLEWPTVFCRALDIAPDMDTDVAVSAIISEIHDPDCRIKEIAYGPEGRITLVSQEADVAQEKNNDINSNSVFLVSGGAKGVTAKCVAQLAADHGCRFILMGRSEYADVEEPEWAKNIEEEAELKKAIMMELKNRGEKPTPKAVNQMLKPLLSDREIRKALNAIQQAGATAEYISADVTDEKAIKQSLSPVLEKFGSITGIIHGAGVLADKLIENKTTDDFNAVYFTKIHGLQALLNCVDCSKLTHLALFSSAAGFYGNEAQADYAVANEILNKTAYRFKTLYPNCHVNTFNWGPWDGGMVTPELKRMFAEKGIDVIPVFAGSRLFADELSSTQCTTQVLVGSSMIPNPVFSDSKLRSYRITRNLLPEDNPFLNDHVIGGNPVLPTVCATWWMADACEKLYPGFRFFSCADYRLFKGIVFDNSQPINYTMDIKEISKNNQGEAEFDVKIMSQKPDGKIINHYGALIKLINRSPEMPVYTGFDKSETQVKPGTELYKDGTLFHGPNFQAIERVINITQNKLTMECRIPEIPESDQGQFRTGTFNPFAADPQFQIMLIWVRHHFDAGSLPTKAELGEHFAQIPKGNKFFVSLDIKDSNPAHVKADITTHDENGKVYTRVKGAEVTVSKQLTFS
ncbi:SDR family NAD(P)-dependent oxidoreductase [Desulfobacterales bacterium HSG17]|nr:SDR family NAD(P)-dependent oxidoreductase [Desulfobacterales bacterium HSG17]